MVSQTLEELNHPRVGAVAIPCVEVRQNPQLQQRAPEGPGVPVVYSYVGTAHALRRDAFLRLGGYREFLFHQGEEEDYCIRMLAAGYVVRLGRADPIHHLESPRRDFRRMDLYGRRNNVLFAWCNVPMPFLPVHLAGTIVSGLRRGWRVGRPWRMVQGLAMGYAEIFRRWKQRRPVDARVYRLYRELMWRGGAPLSEIEPRLPPLRER